MKYIVCLGIVGLGLMSWPSLAWAQIYHVYRPESNFSTVADPSIESRPYVELQAAPVFSYGDMTDAAGYNISSIMCGGQGRMLVYVKEYLALGAEGAILHAADMQTHLISRIKRTQWGLVAKGILTPNTEPKVYLIFGIGQVKQQTQFALRSHLLYDRSTVLSVGAGVDIPIWKSLRFGGEYMSRYNTHLWNNFALEGPRWRHEVAANFIVLF